MSSDTHGVKRAIGKYSIGRLGEKRMFQNLYESVFVFHELNANKLRQNGEVVGPL